MAEGMQCMLTQAGMHGSGHRSLADAVGRGSCVRVSQLGSCMRQLPAEVGSFHVTCAEVRLQLRHLVPHTLQLLLQVVLQQSHRRFTHCNTRSMAPTTPFGGHAAQPEVPSAMSHTLVSIGWSLWRHTEAGKFHLTELMSATPSSFSELAIRGSGESRGRALAAPLR